METGLSDITFQMTTVFHCCQWPNLTLQQFFQDQPFKLKLGCLLWKYIQIDQQTENENGKTQDRTG